MIKLVRGKSRLQIEDFVAPEENDADRDGKIDKGEKHPPRIDLFCLHVCLRTASGWSSLGQFDGDSGFAKSAVCSGNRANALANFGLGRRSLRSLPIGPQ